MNLILVILIVLLLCGGIGYGGYRGGPAYAGGGLGAGHSRFAHPLFAGVSAVNFLAWLSDLFQPVPMETTSRTLSIIEGCPWVYAPAAHTIVVTGFLRCETDGVGGAHGDKSHLPKTSYKPDLNADVDRFVSVPMKIRKAVPEVVIGCLVEVEDLHTGKKLLAVCGDAAPDNRTGEGSYCLLGEFGIDQNPNTGGWDASRRFKYTYHVGTPAPGYHLCPA